MKVNAVEKFRHELQDTLTHLHDPDFRPPSHIVAALGCQREQGPVAVQVALTQLIEGHWHSGDTAGSGPNVAERQVLQQRFVLRLSQEETATRLNMSVRTLQRVQRRAVYMLARYLWVQSNPTPTRSEFGESADRPLAQSAPAQTTHPETTRAWQTQVKQELESLHQNSPDSLSDVGVSLQRVLTVGQAVANKRSVVVEAAATPAKLMAAIHPSALRHVLITAIEQMAQRMTMGKITLDAMTQGGAIQITVVGAPVIASTPLHSEQMHEIVATHGGWVEVTTVGDAMRLQIELPSSGQKVVVLVIDDNADLVAFYRRYVAGTHYEINHLADGNRLFAAIEEERPDMIVLDVLLPDLDGWELLTYLHEHPATRTIPILVASVVRGEELALALGAAAYLSKPVRRQEFIQALDQVREWGRG